MKEIAKRLAEKIRFSEHDSILLDSPESNLFDIKKENFFDIPKTRSDKKIAFVDGGNLEIFASPSLSLFFNRVYYTVYYDNKRIKNKLYEFFTMIHAENKEGKIIYNAECFFTKEKLLIKNYEFDSFDKSITIGNKRADISQIGNIIRRFSELTIANETGADYVILDGTLEATYPHEKELLDHIRLPLFGLAKTTSLLTGKGNSAAALLNGLAENKSWGYHVGKSESKNHDAHIYFLKLNEKSDYVFRFEANQKEDVETVISLLAENSKDPIFIGYPYGLIEADRFARVTNKEKDTLVLQLSVLFGKDIDKAKHLVNSSNAHSILDKMS